MNPVCGRPPGAIGGAPAGWPPSEAADRRWAVIRGRGSPRESVDPGLGLALEVGDLGRLVLDTVLRMGELVLGLALALFLATLAPQRRIVGQIAGRLLEPSGQLVHDAHALALPACAAGHAQTTCEMVPAGVCGPGPQRASAEERHGGDDCPRSEADPIPQRGLRQGAGARPGAPGAHRD